MNRRPEAVLANVIGWEGAGFHALSGGTNNRTFLVEKDGKRAVLKIDVEARSLPFNSREDEARVQSVAADHDLAGGVLYVDDCTYMSEFVDGHVWGLADLAAEHDIVRLSRAVKAIHSLPLTGRSYDASYAVHTYLPQINNRDVNTMRRCADIVFSMGLPANMCCCHNDLAVGNIISTPKLQFLDWEYACDNDPLFDIATVIAHHNLSDYQADLFLNSYFDGDGNRWRPKLQEQMLFYDALHWLWLAARSGADENEQKLDDLAERVLQADLS